MSATLGSVRVDKAMVFTPHPDDAEITAGGTIAQWVSEGVEVVLCVVTNGACGSNDPEVDKGSLIATRRAEQLASAKILGITDVVFLEHEDGQVEDSMALRIDITREIRRYKPDVVMGPDPSTHYIGQWYVNHPDHRSIGLAFLAAVNPGIETVPWCREELFDQGFEPHSVQACVLSAPPAADLFMDIDDFIESKVAALSAHVSQAPGLVNAGLAARALSLLVAKESGLGCRYAEGFKVIYPGIPEGAMELLAEAGVLEDFA